MNVERYIKNFSSLICEINDNKNFDEVLKSVENYFYKNPIDDDKQGLEGRVWVLIGFKDNTDIPVCLQIGQAENIQKEIIKDIERMYNREYSDTKDEKLNLDSFTEPKQTDNYEDNFTYDVSDKRGKIAYFYRNLKKKYTTLRFYEIIIDEYLAPIQELLPVEKSMYEISKDYYCEAKLATEIGTKNWHLYRSGVGKRFYLLLNNDKTK